MSIESLQNTRTYTDSRRAASPTAGGETTCASFQSQLEQTAAQSRSAVTAAASENDGLMALYQDLAVQDALFESRNAYGLDSSTFLGGGLQDLLYNAKLDMLNRMEEGKEKTEEEQAWDRLMAYVDAWIERIQEEAKLNKEAAERAARISKDFKKEIEAAQLERKDRLADFLLEGLRKKLL